MKEIFRKILEGIDSRLPHYFLVKGGRLQVVPLSVEQYDNLLNNGYEPLIETAYNELDREVLEALNEIVGKLGNRAVLLYPFAVSAILSYEASRPGAPLNKALHKKKGDSKTNKASTEVKRKKKNDEE